MSIVYDVVNSIISAICGALTSVFELLPQSPFKSIDTSNISEFMGYLNWFIPVKHILNITLLWLACITAYYIYSIALRWFKAVE